MPLIFRFPRVASTQPLIFNRQGPGFGQLAGVAAASGLAGVKLHVGKVAGVATAGGLDAVKVHVGKVAGVATAGGLDAVKVHVGKVAGVATAQAGLTSMYDINVPRGPRAQFQFAIGPAGRLAQSAQVGIASASPTRSEARIGTGSSARAVAGARIGIGGTSRSVAEAHVGIGAASLALTQAGIGIASAVPVVVSGRAVIVHAYRAVAVAQTGVAHASPVAQGVGIIIAPAVRAYAGTSIVLRGASQARRLLEIAWRPGHSPQGIRPPRQPSEWPLPPPVWGGGLPGVPIILPAREFYSVFNQAYLKRVDDGVEIGCLSIDIDTEETSFTRRIDGVVPYSEREKISVLNGPVAVEIGANGAVWQAVIRTVKEVRDHGKDACSFQAYSKSIALSAPAALMRTGMNATAATAAQLVAMELDPYGFQVSWDINDKTGGSVDWAVPATAFSVVGADPISAISALIKPVGAFVLPHRTNAAISVRHRFPSFPWSLASASADVEIPADVLMPLEQDWVEGAGYNGVWAGGVRFGVHALVRIEGTAGDIQLPDFFDPMLTDPIANALAGGTILADQVKKRPVTMSLYAYPEIGFIEPGQIVRVIDDYPWSAIVRGSKIHIEWKGKDGLQVLQTLTGERYYA